MKYFIFDFLKAFYRMLGKIVSYFTVKSFYTSQLKSSFYAGYYSTKFKFLGRNSHILKKIDLIGGKYISINSGFACLGKLRLEAHDLHNNKSYYPSLTIGKNVGINFDCHIGCINRIEIGDNVLLASKVFITDHSHGDSTPEFKDTAPSMRHLISKGPVIIKDNVWIGEGVAIMPNVTIGENCIIGANSVVTKDVPPNSVVGGVPAKILKSIMV